MSLQQIQTILAKIDSSVNGFVQGLPQVERKMWDKVLQIIKQLEIDNLGNVKNNVNNLKVLTQLNQEINAVVINPEYKKKVQQFTGVFTDMASLQNIYLGTVFDKFKPNKTLKEITKASIDITVDQLQDTGVTSALSTEIKDFLKASITTGGSYSDLTDQLKTTILGNEKIPGGLTRYARTYATDSINQFNATYTKQVSQDFKPKWFRYTGSNMTTSREFCKVLKDKDGGYFHINEVPGFLQGQIGTTQVEIYDKYNLPKGMNEATNIDNFFVLRGGYNCGHQIFPVSEASVPEELRSRFI